jgi:hypothetical protein
MTMRQPTPPEVLYDHWTRTLAGERLPITEGEPQVGFWATRMVKGGPLIPVAIWAVQVTGDDGELLEEERLVAKIGPYDMIDPIKVWVGSARRPISFEEYQRMIADWETRGDPMKAADPLKTRSAF